MGVDEWGTPRILALLRRAESDPLHETAGRARDFGSGLFVFAVG